jgi:hypothetical protein
VFCLPGAITPSLPEATIDALSIAAVKTFREETFMAAIGGE